MNRRKRTLPRWARVATLVLVAILLAPSGFAGDDVPDAARRNFDKAKAYAAKGGTKNLKRSWKLLTKLRDPAARSCDFWLLYLDVGTALEKEPEKLWAAIEKREAANPGCPTFDILRARTATTLADRKAHIEKAREKAPDDIAVKLMYAAILVEEEEEFDAEEMIDEILATDPGNEGALVLKGRIQLVGGYNNAAVEFADEHLAAHPLPGLHHLKAEALLAMFDEDGKDTLADALTCAEAAIAGAPEAPYIVTLARVLEKQGDTAKAKAAVAKHFAASPSPLLAALLGEYAFADGDYLAAIKGFQVGAGQDLRAAKGLAACYARLGRKEEAIAAVEGVRRLAPDEALFRSDVLSAVGEHDQALKALEGSDDESAPYARAWIHAILARPSAIKDAVANGAPSGNTAVEFYGLCWLRGSLMEKMGKNAAAGVNTKLGRAEIAAATKGIPNLERDVEATIDLAAATLLYMTRVPFYFRSACGTPFVAADRPGISMDRNADNEWLQSFEVSASANCARDPARVFKFNEQVVKEGELNVEFGDSEALKNAFSEGLAKLAGGDPAGAKAAFDKAAEIEPNWHRLAIFSACADALASSDNVASAAKTALAASEDWPDDHDGRMLALTLAIWAGQDVSAEIQSWAERAEANGERRLSEL